MFLADPPIAADSVIMSVTFDGPNINIAKLEGNLNGGTFSLRGKFRATSDGISQSDLTFRGRSVFLDYPRGFQTASNLNLTLKNEGRNLVLGGRATILDGGYREGIDLTLLTRARSARYLSLRSRSVSLKIFASTLLSRHGSRSSSTTTWAAFKRMPISDWSEPRSVLV